MQPFWLYLITSLITDRITRNGNANWYWFIQRLEKWYCLCSVHLYSWLKWNGNQFVRYLFLTLRAPNLSTICRSHLAIVCLDLSTQLYAPSMITSHPQNLIIWFILLTYHSPQTKEWDVLISSDVFLFSFVGILICLWSILSSVHISSPYSKNKIKRKKKESKVVSLNICHTTTASLNLYHADRETHEWERWW